MQANCGAQRRLLGLRGWRFVRAMQTGQPARLEWGVNSLPFLPTQDSVHSPTFPGLWRSGRFSWGGRSPHQGHHRGPKDCCCPLLWMLQGQGLDSHSPHLCTLVGLHRGGLTGEGRRVGWPSQLPLLSSLKQDLEPGLRLPCCSVVLSREERGRKTQNRNPQISDQLW